MTAKGTKKLMCEKIESEKKEKKAASSKVLF
jgi:hypothetical protein